jgi:hypothetical protein
MRDIYMMNVVHLTTLGGYLVGYGMGGSIGETGGSY